MAAFIKKGLEQSAYNVDWSSHGEDGLEYALMNDYDALIIDLMLPGIDGLSIVREVRKAGKGVPILALTARSALEDRVQGLDAGCDDYLAKPFAFDELLARLRALLRRQSGKRRSFDETGVRRSFHGSDKPHGASRRQADRADQQGIFASGDALAASGDRSSLGRRFWRTSGVTTSTRRATCWKST